MRRALIATVGTAAALAGLLSYKSSNAVKAGGTRLSIAGASSAPSTSSTQPSTATSTSPTSAATSPSSTAQTATTPGSSGTVSGPTLAPSTTAAPPTTAAQRVVTGADIQYNYGDIQLRVTFNGSRITKIDIAHESATDGRSQSINSQAIPILTQEALSAQSLNFDIVSGATFTSEAYGQALQSILDPSGG